MRIEREAWRKYRVISGADGDIVNAVGVSGVKSEAEEVKREEEVQRKGR